MTHRLFAVALGIRSVADCARSSAGARPACLAAAAWLSTAQQQLQSTTFASAAFASAEPLSDLQPPPLCHASGAPLSAGNSKLRVAVAPQLAVEPPPPCFDDARAAFSSHSTSSLLRSLAVLSMCTVQPLVNNAEALLAQAKAVFGRTLVNAAVKRTLFRQFCPGEDSVEIQSMLRRLRASNLGAILNYSVENDMAGSAAGGTPSPEADQAAEALCDANTQKFLESILAAQTAEGQGFASVKMTALCQPDVLQAVSTNLEADPAERSPLTQRHASLMANALNRLVALADAAEAADVRIMLDAEQSYSQPAIDATALQLQRHFNRERCVVYNTFQLYRKDSHERLMADLERAKREGWKFGAKLVRGAYMVQERELAAASGFASPIHNTKLDTDANYDRCVAETLEHVAAGRGTEILVAGHNRASIESAAAAMARLGILPRGGGVAFAQLYGMSDNLSFPLAAAGYQAYKCVHYGPVEELMPYLMRRAQENSDVMGGVGEELRLMRGELRRRAAAALLSGWRTAAASGSTSVAVAAAGRPSAEASAAGGLRGAL